MWARFAVVVVLVSALLLTPFTTIPDSFAAKPPTANGKHKVATLRDSIKIGIGVTLKLTKGLSINIAEPLHLTPSSITTHSSYYSNRQESIMTTTDAISKSTNKVLNNETVGMVDNDVTITITRSFFIPLNESMAITITADSMDYSMNKTLDDGLLLDVSSNTTSDFSLMLDNETLSLDDGEGEGKLNITSGTTPSFYNVTIDEPLSLGLGLGLGQSPIAFNIEKAVDLDAISMATALESNNTSSSNNGSLEKSVWYYTTRFTSPYDHANVDRLASKNVTVIYFSAVNDRFKTSADYAEKVSFINYAKSKDIKVFAVIFQDPLYVMKSPTDLRTKFQNTIDATKDVFDTYVIDVEPHIICKLYPAYPCFDTDEAGYLGRYINMSSTLRTVADENHITYYDTVPWWYHRDIKALVSTEGLDALSSHKINVMDYSTTFTGTMTKLVDIRADVDTPYVVNIKVTPTASDPWLVGIELQKTIDEIKRDGLDLGIFEASYYLTL